MECIVQTTTLTDSNVQHIGLIQWNLTRSAAAAIISTVLARKLAWGEEATPQFSV